MKIRIRNHLHTEVAPLAGAWIEIIPIDSLAEAINVAPLAGAWIEILLCHDWGFKFWVAPLAGAWIEIFGQAEKSY